MEKLLRKRKTRKSRDIMKKELDAATDKRRLRILNIKRDKGR